MWVTLEGEYSDEATVDSWIPRGSVGTDNFPVPHKWPTKLCQIISETICRWLPFASRN
jgi:hypothetical protein